MGFLDRLAGKRSAGSLSPETSAHSLEAFIASSCGSIESLTASSALDAMTRFYQEMSVAPADLDDDGDMLLCQWSPNQWRSPHSFDFDLVRQFILSSGDGDEGMSQLHLTLHFASAAVTDDLEPGNLWCTSSAAISDFTTAVRASSVFAALSELAPDEVEVYWEHV